MTDQFPQITIDPALTPAGATPLQPVPLMPAAMPAALSTTDRLQQRRASVQAELEKIQAEENSLLNNIKDWLTKVQGDETKQQALEQELFALERQLAAPSAEQQAAERSAKLADLNQQLRQAESQLKEVTKLQKIDEKKAFDRYAAGDLDRESLLVEMEKISQRYAEQATAMQKIITAHQGSMQSIAEVIKTSPPAADTAQSTVTPTSQSNVINNNKNLIDKLATLPESNAGVLHHLIHELPNQGSLPTLERSMDGLGIIISAGSNAQMADRYFIADADLLRAGATAEDIIPLSTSSVASHDATPLTSGA